MLHVYFAHKQNTPSEFVCPGHVTGIQQLPSLDSHGWQQFSENT